MAILFDGNQNTLTLHTNHSTYQMKIDPLGFLLHLYYGKSSVGCMDYLLMHSYQDRGFSGNPYDAEEDRTYSMDVLPQEFPYHGTGDYRSPALIIKNNGNFCGSDFRYKSHRITNEKYHIKGLPAVYAEKEEAETLEIFLEDRVSNIEVCLLYGVLPKYDIITRSVRVVNQGGNKIYLEKLLPATLDFVSGDYDFITFYGRHNKERNFQRVPVVHGVHQIGSRRGTSSHQYNPFVILAERNADEENGSCYAMSFLYSGGFQCQVEKDQFNLTRLQMGLQEELFEYPLEPGEVFYSPEVVMSYSSQGIGQLSRNIHKCYRHNLCRGKYKEIPRPLLVNNWESTMFDFNGDLLYGLAKDASALGIEMLVMDDGWFGTRNDDTSGLGDWQVNEEKLGEPLESLIQKINGLGMKFGIWVEPECVNENSRLYREHPDWAFQIPGKRPVRGRGQLMLDFSRKEVVDYLFGQICNVLDQGNIEYVKWDMNRSFYDIYSNGGKEQGRVLHDYILGLYDFLERLITRYPNILFEGCSGGGGRFDAGMLYYTPQIWCSDNTDAIDRVFIQYGTSFGYPISSIASHVSAVPNQQTSRMVSLHTRGVTAMGGVLGYELDLRELTEDEKEEVRQQVKTYHKYEALVQNGDYYRLTNPFENQAGAWAVVAEDKSEVLVSAVSLECHGNAPIVYIKLQGLKSGCIYRDTESGQEYPSDALMGAGMPLPMINTYVAPMQTENEGAKPLPVVGQEHQAWQWHLELVEK